MQVHGENPLALPVAGTAKERRLLRRTRLGHPIATVADFLAAVLMFDRRHPLLSIMLRSAGLLDNDLLAADSLRSQDSDA